MMKSKEWSMICLFIGRGVCITALWLHCLPLTIVATALLGLGFLIRIGEIVEDD